jgi:hypothetical protein
VFCRIPAATIAELEIRNAFVGHRPEWFYGRQTTPYRPHLNPPFCLLCLAEQVRSGCPLHVQAAWAVPVFTHCPSRLWPFQASCNSCWTNDPVEWLATGRHQPILCKHCSQPLTTKLDKAPPGKGFLTIVSLEAAILAASRGSSRDTFWAGSLCRMFHANDRRLDSAPHPSGVRARINGRQTSRSRRVPLRLATPSGCRATRAVYPSSRSPSDDHGGCRELPARPPKSVLLPVSNADRVRTPAILSPIN